MLLCFHEEVSPENEELAKNHRNHIFHAVGSATDQMDVDYLTNIIELADRMLAWLHFWKELQRARDLLEHQLFLTSSLHADKTSHPDVATALHNIGQVCVELGDLPASATFFNQAITAEVSVNGTSECDDIASSLNGLGQTKNPEDEEELNRDIAITLNNFGLTASASDVAQTLANLANVSHAHDNYAASIRLNLESLEIKKEFYRDLSRDGESLGGKKSIMGLSIISRDDNADRRKSIVGRLSILGIELNDPEKDKASRRKSFLGSNQADDDKASHRKSIFGSNESDNTSRHKSFLGSFSQTKSLDSRAPSFIGSDVGSRTSESRISIGRFGSPQRDRENGPVIVKNRDIANHLNLLGTVASDSGDYKLAEKYFMEALDTDIAVYGTRDHPDCGLLLNNLGIAAYDRQDFDSAKRYYEQALSVYISVHGTRNHSDCAMAINNL
ncbi:hypothetical protein HK096_008851 [Nowakowskiella sp. JEL0078]|nr:hypothetical protein HK096_008851 [Nowakowskiella sp. JEL0078]